MSQVHIMSLKEFQAKKLHTVRAVSPYNLTIFPLAVIVSLFYRDLYNTDPGERDLLVKKMSLFKSNFQLLIYCHWQYISIILVMPGSHCPIFWECKESKARFYLSDACN